MNIKGFRSLEHNRGANYFELALVVYSTSISPSMQYCTIYKSEQPFVVKRLISSLKECSVSGGLGPFLQTVSLVSFQEILLVRQ